jgi:hypothetical protein
MARPFATRTANSIPITSLTKDRPKKILTGRTRQFTAGYSLRYLEIRCSTTIEQCRKQSKSKKPTCKANSAWPTMTPESPISSISSEKSQNRTSRKLSRAPTQSKANPWTLSTKRKSSDQRLCASHASCTTSGESSSPAKTAHQPKIATKNDDLALPLAYKQPPTIATAPSDYQVESSQNSDPNLPAVPKNPSKYPFMMSQPASPLDSKPSKVRLLLPGKLVVKKPEDSEESEESEEY